MADRRTRRKKGATVGGGKCRWEKERLEVVINLSNVLIEKGL
jgi:hypothetical protein